MEGQVPCWYRGPWEPPYPAQCSGPAAGWWRVGEPLVGGEQAPSIYSWGLQTWGPQGRQEEASMRPWGVAITQGWAWAHPRVTP